MKVIVKHPPVFQHHPIIAAVRDVDLIERAAESPVSAIFLMAGDIFTIKNCVEAARGARKAIFLHVDLIRGIANDREGIRYVARVLAPDGIVSTKSHLLHSARKEGLLTIQHVFLIDTHAYETGVKGIKDFGPDAVELMPGLMPRVIADMKREVTCPIVTAGLIKHVSEVASVIRAGAGAAAIGTPDLWSVTMDEVTAELRKLAP